MAKGSKASYSSKQKRKASHIEEGYEKRGVGKKEAESRAWRTVNKQDGGAKTKAKSKASKKASTSSKSTKSGSKAKSTAKKASSTRKKASSKR